MTFASAGPSARKNSPALLAMVVVGWVLMVICLLHLLGYLSLPGLGPRDVNVMMALLSVMLVETLLCWQYLRRGLLQAAPASARMRAELIEAAGEDETAREAAREALRRGGNYTQWDHRSELLRIARLAREGKEREFLGSAR